MKKIVPLCALLMLVAIPAFSASFPNYAVLKAGAYFPQASDLDEFDNSFYGELGFGHYLSNNIALEFGAGYTETSASASDPSGSVDVDVTIIPVTLGLKFVLPAGTFEPFAMAGIGLYFVDVDASASISGVGIFSGSEDDTTFGAFLGAGANFDVSPNTFLGFEAKYFFASPSFGGEDIDINGITLTANIGFRF